MNLLRSKDQFSDELIETCNKPSTFILHLFTDHIAAEAYEGVLE